jgi:hypothetical protein
MILHAKQRLLATKEFQYGLVNRPPAIGAVPKGFTHHDPDNHGIDGVRHGILTYPHALSDSEVKQYELLPLSGKDGQPLEVPKFPKAVIRKTQEAIDSLNYIKNENMTDMDDEIAELEKVLDIFRDYAKHKRLNAEKALKELGYEHSNR